MKGIHQELEATGFSQWSIHPKFIMSIKLAAYGKLGFRGSGPSQCWINRRQFAQSGQFELPPHTIQLLWSDSISVN